MSKLADNNSYEECECTFFHIWIGFLFLLQMLILIKIRNIVVKQDNNANVNDDNEKAWMNSVEYAENVKYDRDADNDIDDINNDEDYIPSLSQQNTFYVSLNKNENISKSHPQRVRVLRNRKITTSSEK